MYLPLHNVSGRKYLIRLSLEKIMLFVVFLPLSAFVICVLLTMLKDFTKSNHTHCNVPNIFPSISASIGNYYPQITIWETAIYIHLPLRFFIVHIRYKNYRSVIKNDLSVIVKLAVFLNVVENVALLGLSYWTSSLYYPYHEFCFKVFVGASIFYMLFTCILLTKYRRRQQLTDDERFSVKMKWRLLIVNAGSFALAAYFFIRHNKHCEPYVYSMFGFAEYIFVTSNIGYHVTTIYDMPNQYIFFTKKGILVDYK